MKHCENSLQKIKSLRQKEKQEYQVEERSMVPATSSIVTFLRRPPIQSCTDKIIINLSDWSLPINKNSTFQKSFSSFILCVHFYEAEAYQVNRKTETQKPQLRTHFAESAKFKIFVLFR